MNIYAVNINPFQLARELDDTTLHNQLKYMHAMVAYIDTQSTHRYVTSKFKEWACHGESSKQNEHRWCHIVYHACYGEYRYRFNKPLIDPHPIDGSVHQAPTLEGVGRLILYHDPQYESLDFTWFYPTERAYQFLLRSQYLSYEPKWTKRERPEWSIETNLQWRFLSMKFDHLQNDTCLRCGKPIKIKRYGGFGLDSFSYQCKSKGCIYHKTSSQK